MPNNNLPPAPAKPEQKKPRKFDIKKHSTAILIVVNITLLAANITLLWFLPQQRQEAIKTRSEIFANNLQMQSAQKLVTDLSASKEEIDKVEKILPTKSQLLSIIQEIETLKEQATIQHFSFEGEIPQKDKNGNFFLPITLVLEGTVSEISAALSQLQRKPHLYTITQSRVEIPSGLSEKVVIFLNVRLYVKEAFNQN